MKVVNVFLQHQTAIGYYKMINKNNKDSKYYGLAT